MAIASLVCGRLRDVGEALMAPATSADPAWETLARFFNSVASEQGMIQRD